MPAIKWEKSEADSEQDSDSDGNRSEEEITLDSFGVDHTKQGQCLLVSCLSSEPKQFC